MEKKIVESLFELAGFEVKSIHEVINGYWPKNEHYFQMIIDNPWWLVETQYGLIKIGRRKRVWQIDYKGTRLREPVFDYNEIKVTSEDTYFHAYTSDFMLKYMIVLQEKLHKLSIPVSE